MTLRNLLLLNGIALLAFALAILLLPATILDLFGITTGQGERLLGQLVGGLVGGIAHHKLGNITLDFRRDERVKKRLRGLGYLPRSMDVKIIFILVICGIIGALIGVFLAPHTAGIPFIRVWGSVVTSFAAGTMVLGEKRKNWWFWVWLYALVSFIYFISRALFINGVGLWPVVANTFVNWSSLILFVLPTRTLFARWINGKQWGLVIAGVGFGTWMVFGITHTCLAAITYHMFNWPEEVWITLIPIIPFENLMRAVVGMIIGGGVIAGLRSIGLVKPDKAIY